MRTRIGRAAPAALVVVVFAFSGIAAAGGLSKDEYIEAADNICAQANQLRDETAQAIFSTLGEGEEPTSDQLAEYVAGVAPITQQEIDSLRDLPAPDGDAKKVKKIYKRVQKALDKIVDDPDVLLEGPDPFAKANKAAQKYGFEVCGAESVD